MTTAYVVVVFNDVRLPTLQFECIEKFCKDDGIEIVMVDNSTDPDACVAMSALAREHHARYLRTDPSAPSAGASHASALRQVHAELQAYERIVWFDHDLFPIAEFSAAGELKGAAAAGILQAGSPAYPGYDPSWRYFWPGCVFLDNRTGNAEIFSLDNNSFCDVGGKSGEFIAEVGRGRIRELSESHERNPYFNKGCYSVYSLISGKFLHFINGGGWNAEEAEHQDERIEILLRLVRELAGLEAAA